MFGLDPRAARVAWTVGLVALAFYAVYTIRKTLLIFVLALFVAYLMEPLVRLIERYNWRRLPRSVSVAEAFILVIAVLALVAALTAPTVSDQAQKLADQLPNLTEKSVFMEKVPLPSWLEPYRARVGTLVQESLKEAATAALPFAKDVGAEVFHFAGNLIFVVLIPIIAFIYVKDGPQIKQALLREVGPSAQRRELSQILSELHDALGQYVRALGLLSLATLIAYSIFFSVTGVPYGMFLAAIAALFEIIPVLGPLTAAVAALLVAGVSGYGHLLWIAGFFVGYRIFQDYVLAPYLMGGGIGVHPALVIFGLLAGEQLGGVAGIFLSVPVIATLGILARHVREKQSDLPR